jgi:citrate synthase
MSQPATSIQVSLQITKESLETGLRGVPVGYCTTSQVEADKGLFYVGNPVEAISDRDPEDVIYLLLYKRWPSAEDRHEFDQLIKDRQHLDPSVAFALKVLPRKGHPMKWMLTALSVMGMVNPTKDYRRQAIDLIAQIPVAVAAIFRIREGWGDPIPPREDLGYMENFVYMLGIPGHTPAQDARLVKLMRPFHITHLDHGGGNLSTFTGKAIASGKADMYEAMVGAMAALAGPLHGKANQECLEFIQDCVGRLGPTFEAADVEKMLRDKLAKKEVVYGFGHAVLRVEDPRARVLRQVGEQLCPNDTNFKMVKLLAEVGPKVLKENPKISDPHPNVDSASGSLLMACGLSNPEYYTVLFGLSRVVGIAAQIVYERCEARGGKGTPIIRPKYYFAATGTAKGEAEITGSG